MGHSGVVVKPPTVTLRLARSGRPSTGVLAATATVVVRIGGGCVTPRRHHADMNVTEVPPRFVVLVASEVLRLHGRAATGVAGIDAATSIAEVTGGLYRAQHYPSTYHLHTATDAEELLGYAITRVEPAGAHFGNPISRASGIVSAWPSGARLVEWIAVHPSARRNGIGSTLLVHCTEGHRFYAYVANANEVSQAFFRSHGASVVGRSGNQVVMG